ncbi:MAG: methylenetetrahydrofolate dehydrogenase (NADP+)/methenyltetrahydrofolate cyclohydrolase [Planctomycetota bacterium]|jgi:methylenetetrahydrofolate dehydrogenase (NADP+)/methenyltetrahydrofolate cyclohydrolase
MANIIDGKAIAKRIRSEVKSGVEVLLQETERVPFIIAVSVGKDDENEAYTRNQGKTAGKLGIKHRLDVLDKDTPFDQVKAHLGSLAIDPEITGIMIQMPLPKHLDESACRALIPMAKDVEAVTDEAAGRVLQNTHQVAPCTAMAAMLCLEAAAPEGITGLNVAIVGRSAIVGRPLAMLLLHANATPTICHTRTRDMAATLKSADVVIAAAGRAGLVTGEMIREGAIAIDVGTNWIESEGRLCGDMNFDEVEAIAGAITPVPGGVGPVTVAVLMRNALILAQNN